MVHAAEGGGEVLLAAGSCRVDTRGLRRWGGEAWVTRGAADVVVCNGRFPKGLGTTRMLIRVEVMRRWPLRRGRGCISLMGASACC